MCNYLTININFTPEGVQGIRRLSNNDDRFFYAINSHSPGILPIFALRNQLKA